MTVLQRQSLPGIIYLRHHTFLMQAIALRTIQLEQASTFPKSCVYAALKLLLTAFMICILRRSKAVGLIRTGWHDGQPSQKAAYLPGCT